MGQITTLRVMHCVAQLTFVLSYVILHKIRILTQIDRLHRQLSQSLLAIDRRLRPTHDTASMFMTHTILTIHLSLSLCLSRKHTRTSRTRPRSSPLDFSLYNPLVNSKTRRCDRGRSDRTGPTGVSLRLIDEVISISFALSFPLSDKCLIKTE